MIELVSIGIFVPWTVWTWIYIAWVWTRRTKKNGLLWNILQETKQAFIVLTIVKIAFRDPVNLLPDSAWLLPIIWLVDLVWIYWARKLGDDDRWKKRRKKAAARVREVAGRLVIVPEAVPVSTS